MRGLVRLVVHALHLLLTVLLASAKRVTMSHIEVISGVEGVSAGLWIL